MSGKLGADAPYTPHQYLQRTALSLPADTQFQKVIVKLASANRTCEGVMRSIKGLHGCHVGPRGWQQPCRAVRALSRCNVNPLCLVLWRYYPDPKNLPYHSWKAHLSSRFGTR